MKKQVVILILAVIVINCGWLQANPADINNSGKVDMADLHILSNAWSSDDTPTPHWNPACDISDPNDGFIDGLDFAVMFANWLWPAPSTLQFAFIPTGTFEMGDHHDSMSNALPVHTVTLDSFYMSKYEITNQQYCDYLNSAYPALIKVDAGVVYAADDTSSSSPYCNTSTANFSYSQINYSEGVFSVSIKGGTTDMSNHPMVEVSWYGAVAYCNWKSQQEGLESCYDLSTWDCDFTKNGLRLPTEAEWEYAARDGLSGKRFPWGNTITHSQANYHSSNFLDYDISPTQGYHPTWNDGIYPYTSPAGSFSTNSFGVYDMVGNVWEWCNDRYWNMYYSSSPSNNPTGPVSGSGRILRGGSWVMSYGASGCRVAFRYDLYPPTRGHNCGFRVCVFASH